MDYETVDADSFGRSLKGIGLNLLVRDVKAECAFLEGLFLGWLRIRSLRILPLSPMARRYSSCTATAPMLRTRCWGSCRKTPPRGAGVEIRLYETDPDAAAARAEAFGATVLQAPADKPHGLREAYILCENGYAWVPGRPK